MAQIVLLLLAVRREAGTGERARPWTIGAVSGVATFAPMLIWVALPAGPAGWILLTALQTSFTLVFTVVVVRWIDRPALLWVAPVLWTGLEAWRGVFPLNGFDWGGLGYAHAGGSPILQAARVVGGRGLTLLTVLIAVALVLGWTRLRDGDGPALHVAVLVAGLALPGLLAPAPPASVGSVDVLAVQSNDLEDSPFPAADEDRYIARQAADLTLGAVVNGGAPDLTVWPESSIDRDVARAPDLAAIVAEAAAATDGNLVYGTLLDGPRPATFLNATVVAGSDGREQQRYVKRHLVPFGEYVPWRHLIGDLPPLRQVPRDGLPGPGPQTLDVNGVRIAVAICFETLFPEVVRSNIREGGAGLILATTNDASFGRGWEPAQHLAQSRLRAVETGRWVVHAAISGTSAFVDPDGGVHQRTDLYTPATIRRDVPVVAGETIFLRLGDLVGLFTRMLSVVLLVAWAVARRREPPQEHP